VVERAPAREVHIILDNRSAHNSQVVRDFLPAHPNVHFHFTASPLSNAQSANAKPIQWKYSDGPPHPP
jgi:hypothetical protein